MFKVFIIVALKGAQLELDYSSLQGAVNRRDRKFDIFDNPMMGLHVASLYSFRNAGRSD